MIFTYFEACDIISGIRITFDIGPLKYCISQAVKENR